MKKLVTVFFLIFSMNFLFSDVSADMYELWLKATENPEKVGIGVYTSTYSGLKPECEGCEEPDTTEEMEECSNRGCGNPYEAKYVSEVAGEVYRGKFDDAKKLTEVVKINFDDYFDECVAPGHYEYIVYGDFLFDLCKRTDCSNFAEITIPAHSKNCLLQSKVTMTQEEFESMKYPFSDEDFESNDDENDDSVTDDQDQSDESGSVLDNDNEPEKPDTSNKTDSDGCSLLII